MPQPKKIAKLPADIRMWFERAVVERGFSDIVELTQELNAICAKQGVPITIGKSAVGLESQRIKRAQEAVRMTTEAARLIAESSPDEGDNRSAAAMALVQSEMFGVLLRIQETGSEELDDVARLEVMNDAALGLSRLSRSRVNQAKWNADVEARTKAAADKVAKIARKGGADAKTVAEIRSQILGIAKREPQTQPTAGAAA